MNTINRIEGKKPSRLMLPPMGILKIDLFMKGAPYITWDLALSSVRLAIRERALCKSMLKIKQQGHRGAYLLRDKIAFVRFKISNLETTLENIQVRHQLYMKDLLKPTS
ncbi:hypothetical protein Tco_1129915 [Tanacetum coccineum]